LILYAYYIIPDREKQGKNNKKINYFGQLLKSTFYEIINLYQKKIRRPKMLLRISNLGVMKEGF